RRLCTERAHRTSPAERRQARQNGTFGGKMLRRSLDAGVRCEASRGLARRGVGCLWSVSKGQGAVAGMLSCVTRRRGGVARALRLLAGVPGRVEELVGGGFDGVVDGVGGFVGGDPADEGGEPDPLEGAGEFVVGGGGVCGPD